MQTEIIVFITYDTEIHLKYKNPKSNFDEQSTSVSKMTKSIEDTLKIILEKLTKLEKSIIRNSEEIRYLEPQSRITKIRNISIIKSVTKKTIQ